MTVAAPDLLHTIVAAATRIVEIRQEARPARQLEASLVRAPAGRAFAAALRATGGLKVIAECKRRSPSKGTLREAYDPAEHARAYADAGAAAISILTEPTFFDGAPEHLSAARAAVHVPLLRKDFIVSEYQLLEAAALGADAVLLIVGALDGAALKNLVRAAEWLGLASLVEVHDLGELRRALEAGATIVGVNSRNLRTLEVDHGIQEQLAGHLPAGVTTVAESGIRTHADLVRLGALGYHAFLVGEQLMTTPDPGAALRELLGEHP
ncbi:MAG: indole-3-glycerol phosphate synthase TrpC [Acidobacteria bacterium]|nr:indole-3-glycerol phosphate synthase TrpC [Acidobacteriota bacterium]MBA3886182.1 indole-3-glycerol phosphate synthase TrpC [Acidobacteriota bacterium]